MQLAEQRRRFAVGTRILREGDHGDCAYVIESGEVVLLAHARGRPVQVATLRSGDVFGELSLIDDAPRPATVIATQDTDVVIIRREQLRSHLDKADPIVEMLLRVTGRRYRSMLRQMLELESIAPPETPRRQVLRDPTDDEFRRVRTRTIERVRSEQQLKRALELGQLELSYQPIVALEEMRNAGFEALLRWRHPVRGLLLPAEFIGIAEASRLIVPIGQWVLEESLAQLGRLQQVMAASHPAAPPAFVAINVSGCQLVDSMAVDRMVATIRNAQVSPSTLHLEVTESALIEDPDRAAVALRQLKATGVSLSIDDFGTGYSSLSYLHHFPLDTLKIDRSFVARIANDAHSMRIVRAVARLARDLGMDVVAEGIEDQSEMDLVRDCGCDYGQGYMISRPITTAESLVYAAADPAGRAASRAP